MKLVPGCRVVLQGPTVDIWFHPMVAVTDVRSKASRFVPHGTEALVIGVECFNKRDPMFATFVQLYAAEHGFFRLEATRVRVIWSPVQGDNDKG